MGVIESFDQWGDGIIEEVTRETHELEHKVQEQSKLIDELQLTNADLHTRYGNAKFHVDKLINDKGKLQQENELLKKTVHEDKEHRKVLEEMHKDRVEWFENMEVVDNTKFEHSITKEDVASAVNGKCVGFTNKNDGFTALIVLEDENYRDGIRHLTLTLKFNLDYECHKFYLIENMNGTDQVWGYSGDMPTNDEQLFDAWTDNRYWCLIKDPKEMAYYK